MRHTAIHVLTGMVFLLAAECVAVCQNPKEPSIPSDQHWSPDSGYGSFEIQPRVLDTDGPAATSKFIGELVKRTARKWVVSLLQMRGPHDSRQERYLSHSFCIRMGG